MNNSKLLKTGDVIFLKKGMNIQTYIQKNKHFATQYDICIGDKLKFEKTIYSKSKLVLLKKGFAYFLKRALKKETNDFITQLNLYNDVFDTSIFARKYTVEFTHEIRGKYTVFCKKPENNIYVTFVQSKDNNNFIKLSRR